MASMAVTGWRLANGGVAKASISNGYNMAYRRNNPISK